MSTLDQPILIANSNYHVGHQVAIFVAKEQGFFGEEGLKEYEYDSRGLIPGPIERDGLAMAITNHGVDIATAVDVEAAIYQRSLGADVYIVGGWRYTPFLNWYGAKHVTDMSKLRGGRIGMREKEGLVQVFITDALRAAGVDPEKEVEWVYDPVFGYRNNPAHMEMLRSGKIEAITSQPPFSDQLEKEGYPMILDPNKVFPRRPGKLTVATGQMIEKRGDELRAYFRAIIRGLLVHARREKLRIPARPREKAEKNQYPQRRRARRGGHRHLARPVGELGVAHRRRHRARGGAANRR